MFRFTYMHLKGFGLKKNDKSKCFEDGWTNTLFFILNTLLWKRSLAVIFRSGHSPAAAALTGSGLSAGSGHSKGRWSPTSCCRLLQELFHFPFFSTRLRLEPSLAADHGWGSPERSAWCCTLYRWASSTAQLSCILQPKNTNSSSFLAVGPYVLHHMAYHEHFGKLITFHCAKHTHYLASLSVPSV